MLFEALNQSGVSMIIAENSKDINPGCYSRAFFTKSADQKYGSSYLALAT